MGNPALVQFPFLAQAFTSTVAHDFILDEQGEANQTIQPNVAATDFDSFLDYLENIAAAMNTASTGGNTYAVYVEADQGRIRIERVAGSTDFKLDFSNDDNSKALGWILGFSWQVTRAYLSAFRGEIHPRYLWIPARPIADISEPKSSPIIANKDFTGGVSTSNFDFTFKNNEAEFRFLIRQKALKREKDEFSFTDQESFQQFWEDARSGKLITLYKDWVDPDDNDTTFTISQVEDNKALNSSSRASEAAAAFTLLHIDDDDASDEYKNNREMVVASGPGKGQRRIIEDSTIKDSDEGYWVVDNFDAGVIPTTASTLRSMVKPITGYFDPSMSDLSVTRMDTAVLYYTARLILI